MTGAQLELVDFPPVPGEPGDGEELVRAAQATIEALDQQHALQPWHKLDAAIVLEAARGVTRSRGIAKSQMVAALLQARSRLPEPIITETDDVKVEYEARRELAWLDAHAADASDEEEP